MKPVPFNSTVSDITHYVFEQVLQLPLPDAVNINLYDGGLQMVGWHSDNEPIFDCDDVRIYSLTLGDGRDFQLVRKDLRKTEGKFKRSTRPDPADVYTIHLGDGDLIGMAGLTQRHYDHQVGQAAASSGARINLTWRYIKHHCTGCTNIISIDHLDID